MCKHLVSSANRYGMAEDKTSGISFIYYKTKRSGPRILPWGTPETTGSRADKLPFILTHCVLEDR